MIQTKFIDGLLLREMVIAGANLLEKNREKWVRMAITNTASSGFFSSDRTIWEYNDRIWRMK